MNCIRTIHLFTSAYPPIISGSKASTLLPYLKNPVTVSTRCPVPVFLKPYLLPTKNEEQATSDYILKIYRASIPHMPKTAAKFGNDLQLVLQPMVLKPSAAAGLSVSKLFESGTRVFHNVRVRRPYKKPWLASAQLSSI